MYALPALQNDVVHSPGWSALLDPIFLFFVIVVALSIGVVFYFGLRRDREPPSDPGGDV